MYCQSCGALTQGLSYCSRCGANLLPAIKTPVSRIVGLAWSIPLAMALITLGGLGMVTFLGYQILKHGAVVSANTAVLLLTDVFIVAILDWMLLRRLSRVIDICQPYRQMGDSSQSLEQQDQREIESREPPSIVTERTTRMLHSSNRS